MTQHYIGTKQVLAWEAAKDGKPGYAVQYEDGYTSWSPKDVFEAAYISIGHVGHLPPFHQRLIGERAQLADRITKLVAFMGTENFLRLGAVSQSDLNSQLDTMLSYRRILDERLVALNQTQA